MKITHKINMNTTMKIVQLGIILMMAIAISCSNKPKAGQPGAAGAVKEYPVIAVKPQSTQLFKDYPTKLQGQQTVEIRS